MIYIYIHILYKHIYTMIYKYIICIHMIYTDIYLHMFIYINTQRHLIFYYTNANIFSRVSPLAFILISSANSPGIFQIRQPSSRRGQITSKSDLLYLVFPCNIYWPMIALLQMLTAYSVQEDMTL